MTSSKPRPSPNKPMNSPPLSASSSLLQSLRDALSKGSFLGLLFSCLALVVLTGKWYWLIAGTFLVLIFSLLQQGLLQNAEPDTRLTLEGRSTVAATAVAVFAALNTGSNLLFLVVGALTSILILSKFAAEISMRRLQVRRHAPDRAVAGDVVQCDVWIRNARQSLSNFGLSLEERSDRDWGLKGHSTFFPYIPAGQTATAHIHVELRRRGEISLLGVRVRSSFPIGLVEKSIPVDMPWPIVVHPRRLPINRQALEQLFGEVGEGLNNSLRALEQWDRLRNLRDYRSGDSLRRVHWRTTAKRQCLTVKEFERPRPQHLAIMVYGPTRMGRKAALKSDRNFERALSLTASLLDILAMKDQPVTLVVATDSVEDWSMQGSRGLTEALDLLAYAQLGGELSELCERIRWRARDHSLLVISSADEASPDHAELKRRLPEAKILSPSAWPRLLEDAS